MLFFRNWIWLKKWGFSWLLKGLVKKKKRSQDSFFDILKKILHWHISIASEMKRQSARQNRADQNDYRSAETDASDQCVVFLDHVDYQLWATLVKLFQNFNLSQFLFLRPWWNSSNLGVNVSGRLNRVETGCCAVGSGRDAARRWHLTQLATPFRCQPVGVLDWSAAFELSKINRN